MVPRSGGQRRAGPGPVHTVALLEVPRQCLGSRKGGAGQATEQVPAQQGAFGESREHGQKEPWEPGSWCGEGIGMTGGRPGEELRRALVPLRWGGRKVTCCIQVAVSRRQTETWTVHCKALCLRVAVVLD